MDHGIIYYNSGTSCTVRLLVSLYSLREFYTGPVTVLSQGESSHTICAKICAALGAEFLRWSPRIPPGPHTINLAKSLYHTASKYEHTLCLDSDTLIVSGIDEIFQMAAKNSFVIASFAGWRSNDPVIAGRIRAWEPYLRDYIEKALNFGPAINSGVIAFRKDAALLQDWLPLALPGRGTFIPEEVCCQIILHRYPHLVADERWNRSCRHDNPYAEGTKILHYHGRKHCRPGLPFGGDMWVKKFDDLLALNCAGIRGWMPAGDNVLRDFLRTRGVAPQLA